MYALVDCNNFYASCERLFNPKLNGKPVVVLSNNDGCVIARSNEAKAVGIPMGAPAYQYQDRFRINQVHVFSANFALYGDLSARIMDILSSHCPDIEIYSIDEAFFFMPGLPDYHAFGLQLRTQILQWTGIPVSIGFAPTKALAKVANRIAKKYPERTQGVYIMDTDVARVKALKWLQIGDVWGIGHRHEKRLLSHGIKTAYDFVQLPDGHVKKQMSIVGLRLKRELSGIPTLSLENTKPKQMIATTRSFDKDYFLLDELRERISTYAFVCSEKLRKQGSNCNGLSIFIQSNFHKADRYGYYSRHQYVQLPYPTSSGFEISKAATAALKRIFKEGVPYKRAGVMISHIVPNDFPQTSMFESPDPRHAALMATVDKANRALGQQKIRLASQDTGRRWKMKQEKLSQRFTTRFDEILTIQ